MPLCNDFSLCYAPFSTLTLTLALTLTSTLSTSSQFQLFNYLCILLCSFLNLCLNLSLSLNLNLNPDPPSYFNHSIIHVLYYSCILLLKLPGSFRRDLPRRPSFARPAGTLLNLNLIPHCISPRAFVAKILTAIASSTTPKNLRTASIPAWPSKRLINPSDLSVIKTNRRLIKIPANTTHSL